MYIICFYKKTTNVYYTNNNNNLKERHTYSLINQNTLKLGTRYIYIESKINYNFIEIK